MRQKRLEHLDPTNPHLLIAKGLPEGEIKALVGHSRNMDTFGTSGHAVNGEMEKTASKLNDIFLDILHGNL